MKSLFLPAIIIGLAIGCAKPAPDFNRLHTGMSESEVIQILGQPDSTAFNDGVKSLYYESYDRDEWTASKINKVFFEVRIVDDRVKSWGLRGDSKAR